MSEEQIEVNEDFEEQDEEANEKPSEKPVKSTVEAAKKAVPKQEVSREVSRMEERRPRRGGAAANVVLVGKKPTMSYVLAVVTQFSEGMNDVHIKARGRSISRAVDVAEVTRNRFIQGAKIDVQIGTDEIIDENNNKINVSTIDITLNK